MGFIKKSERFDKFVLILNALILIIGGYQYLDQGEYFFAAILLLSGVIVLIAVKYKRAFQSQVETILYFFNVIVAFFTSWDFFQHNKHYIQYVWLFVGVVYLFFGLRNIFKKKDLPSAQ